MDTPRIQITGFPRSLYRTPVKTFFLERFWSRKEKLGVRGLLSLCEIAAEQSLALDLGFQRCSAARFGCGAGRAG